MRKLLLFLCLLAAGCGESVKEDELQRSLGNQQAGADEADPGIVAVRIGELGPNFSACALAGTARRPGTDALDVRAAPYDNAAGTGSVAPNARFFICTRSIDQRWLGIVYNEGGTLDPACGVSRPVPSRRDYPGPCRSG
jgi:hypothetical protein